MLERYLPVVGKAAFQANLPAFVAMLGPTYSHEDMIRDDDLGDAIAFSALRLGELEQLISTILFGDGDGDDDDDYDHAARDAIGWMGLFSDAEAEALARRLLDQMRDDSNRCGEVSLLADVITAHGGARPRWEADLQSECDIMYVLCTELQPELLALVTGPRGIQYIATCAEDRPTNADEAKESLLSICKPERWRSVELEYSVTPLVARSCGTNESERDQINSCGVNYDLDIDALEFGVKRNGDAVLERVVIERTSGI